MRKTGFTGKGGLGGIVCAILCLLAFGLPGEELYPVETVRVGFFDEGAIMRANAAGERRGTAVEWIEAVARKCNWQIEWIDTTFMEGIDMLKRGKIDFLPVSGSVAERESLSTAHVVLGVYRGYAFAGRNSSLRMGMPLESFAGRVVGSVKGYSIGRTFAELMEQSGVACEYKEYETLPMLEYAFLKGEVEVALSEQSDMFHDEVPILAIPIASYFMAVTSSRRDLQVKFDDAAASVLDEKPTFYQKLRFKYYPQSSGVMTHFTQKELIWLDNFKKQNKSIGVEIHPEIPPYKTFDSDSKKVGGMLGLILEEVAASTGLRFHAFVPDSSDKERWQRIHRGSVQLWIPYGSEPSVQEELLDEFEPFYELKIPQVYCHLHNKAHLVDINTGVIAVCASEKQRIEAFVRAGRSSQLYLCDSMKDCLRAVVDGKASYTVGDYHSIRDMSIRMGIASKLDIHDSWFNRYEPVLPIYLHLNVDPMLGSILRKALDGISEEHLKYLITQASADEMPLRYVSKTMILNYIGVILFLGLLLFVIMGMRARRRIQAALEETDRARQETENALKEARMTAKFKTNFLATMSHEIRTPLNAVIGFADFLDKPDVPAAQQREYARSIGYAAKVLLSLINDILDLSKLESGRAEELNLLQGSTDMKKLFDEMRTIFKMKTMQKGLALRFVVEDGLPRLKLFEARMRQLLLNLIGNAVKFTERGEITVLCNTFNHMDDGCLDVEVQVRDTGIGISSEGLKKIFDPFAQDIASRQGKVFSGTGLGLAIVKRLVDVSGGSVTAHSILGKGSVFTVRLYHVSVAEDAEDAAAVQQKPLPAASPAAPPVGAVNDVVCVDDIPMNRKILLLYLKSIGITSVHDFGSGQEALEYLANNHTDVVLTDLWMPGMNGVEFAKKVRELAPSTPVMAITADTDSKLSFDTTVFAGILTKPVTAEMLQKALRPIDSGNEVQKG